jgi:hypothetical protein
VNAEQISQQLERIVSSQAFSRADRPRHFLRFLVEHALDPEAPPVDEYLLAVEVFKRSEPFDASSDPIVRVEAGRLRHRLEDYYRGPGQDDPILIELPPRTYTPVFRCRTAPLTPEMTLGDWMAKQNRRTLIAVCLLIVLCGAILFCGGYYAGRTSIQNPGEVPANAPNRAR